jgi:hypothetical protein
LRIDRVMGGALGRRYHLLWSFAVPLYTHARGAPRGRGAALQPLVGPAAMLVFAASSEGAGMQAQQSAWLFGLAAVGHVIIAPYWFQWPGSKHGRLAWRRAPVTLMLVLWCVFAVHQVGGWCAATPAQLAWRCAAMARVGHVLDEHRIRWHATKSTLMEALRNGPQGRPSLSTFNADEDICVHDDDYERACSTLRSLNYLGTVTKNTVRMKGSLVRNFVSLNQGSQFHCWGGKEAYEHAVNKGMIHVPCGAVGAGVDLRVPEDSAGYLRAQYGAPWRTPVIEWGSTRAALHDIGCNLAYDASWPYAPWDDNWTAVLSAVLLFMYTVWWLRIIQNSGGDALFVRATYLPRRWRRHILWCAAIVLVVFLIVWVRRGLLGGATGTLSGNV